jgi:hypothetical protein
MDLTIAGIGDALHPEPQTLATSESRLSLGRIDVGGTNGPDNPEGNHLGGV